MRRALPLAALLLLPGVLGADVPDVDDAEGDVIKPGALIQVGGSFCTLNWIYDEVLTSEEAAEREPRVLAGTAAHCVDHVGQKGSLARSSTIHDPGVQFGEVVYIDADLDYAFIEVHPDHHDLVDPSMAGHPSIPTGVSTTETAAFGDLMQFSGHGGGYHLTAPTRERRVGVLSANNGRWHWVVASATRGDSGGPVANLTDGGKAFGHATALAVGHADGSTTGFQAGTSGVSLEGMLADAAAAGWNVRLRIVNR